MSTFLKKHRKSILIGAIILIALVVISVLFALNNPSSQAAMQGRSWIILGCLVVVLFYSFFANLKKNRKSNKKRKGKKSKI